jgi:hypothetical protein
MKASKPKSDNKAKKSEKKELEKTLTGKILEAVKNLGHDAERVARDVEIAGKFIAKKISKQLKSGKTVKSEVKEKSLKKGEKQVKRVVEKAAVKAKPVVNSVKVPAIASEEKVAQAIKPRAKATPTPKVAKAPVAKTSSAAKKKVIPKQS